MHALVVDDSKAIRAILSKILKELGFEVHEASHGLEALRCLNEIGGVDIALVDLNMPEMNGYELINAVRAQAAYDDMLIMMVTTESEIGSIAAALDAGANEYVMKPFTKEIIIDKLNLLGII